MTFTGHLSEKTAVVLYDFDPEEPGDMLIRKGDTITVNDTTDKWWLAKRGNARGYKPSNFVKVLEKEDVKPVETQHTILGLLQILSSPVDFLLVS